MKERPINLPTPMVNAVLHFRKSQSRILIKPFPVSPEMGMAENGAFTDWRPCYEYGQCVGTRSIIVKCPFGVIGDILWVRETFSVNAENPDDIWYWANGEPPHGAWLKTRRALHMPRSASRIDLRITDVRTERLNDITEADVIAEGYPTGNIKAFSHAWIARHGEGSWNLNPWVWVIEFKRILK